MSGFLWFPDAGSTNNDACDPSKGTIVQPGGQVAAPNIPIVGQHEIWFSACCVGGCAMLSVPLRVHYDLVH